MKKIKVYRVLGGILAVYGIIGYFANLLYKGLERGIILSYPTIVGALTSFVLNIFLWAGLILLWRADKNESPDKKSKWLTFIKIYVIFSLLVVTTAIIIPHLVKSLKG